MVRSAIVSSSPARPEQDGWVERLECPAGFAELPCPDRTDAKARGFERPSRRARGRPWT
jgi:hypothetical protein